MNNSYPNKDCLEAEKMQENEARKLQEREKVLNKKSLHS